MISHPAPTAGTAAAILAALVIAHLIGDYWIQTDHQAATKGHRAADVDRADYPSETAWRRARRHRHAAGWRANLAHVTTYTATAAVVLAAVAWRLGIDLDTGRVAAGLTISATTHAWADRRHTLAWLAHRVGAGGLHRAGSGLATGAHIQDQVWHLTWLTVAALVIA